MSRTIHAPRGYIKQQGPVRFEGHFICTCDSDHDNPECPALKETLRRHIRPPMALTSASQSSQATTSIEPAELLKAIELIENLPDENGHVSRTPVGTACQIEDWGRGKL